MTKSDRLLIEVWMLDIATRMARLALRSGRPLVAAAVVLVAILCGSTRASAVVGAFCLTDVTCGYGEICIKEYPYSPSGTCIKGSR